MHMKRSAPGHSQRLARASQTWTSPLLRRPPNSPTAAALQRPLYQWILLALAMHGKKLILMFGSDSADPSLGHHACTVSLLGSTVTKGCRLRPRDLPSRLPKRRSRTAVSLRAMGKGYMLSKHLETSHSIWTESLSNSEIRTASDSHLHAERATH